MIASAIETKAIDSVQLRGSLASLKQVVEQNVGINEKPELFCFGQQGDERSGVVVRVASISFVPEKFNLQGNADRLEQALRRAKKGGAQIAVAPEGSLDGYVVNEIISGETPAEKMNAAVLASPFHQLLAGPGGQRMGTPSWQLESTTTNWHHAKQVC